MEDNGEAIRARSEAEDVIMDLSSEVSSLPERDVPIDTRVADITPVSSLRACQWDKAGNWWCWRETHIQTRAR